MLKNYSRIRLLNDAHAEEGVRSGALGYIIEVYSDGSYEVEFSDSRTGCTVAQVVLQEDEMRLDPEP